MNTRMQDLFMNITFRKAVYDLPLSQGTLENATEFVKGGKRKMLLETWLELEEACGGAID